MADVFVSYSRADREFVERLTGALQERDKDVWIDWEDIPPTTDWFERISTGIRESDAFVFVMSPDSLASEVCARELEYALEVGKRLIPVLYRDLADLVLPPSLARTQWIEFTEWSEASLDLLAEAIETDQDWVQAHTRLLTLAERWDRSGRDESALLRGSELAADEAWISSEGADRKDPAPTPLQYDYVLTSRQRETRRLRTTRLAVTGGLIIAAILAVVALLQRSEAVQQGDEAKSRALAANSFLNLPTDPELSLLLAREALGVSRTSQAEDALRQSLIASRVRRTLEGNVGPLRDLAVSPDGSKLVTAADDNAAQIWNAETGDLIATLRGHDRSVHQTRFSPDGSLVATVAQDSTVRLWDAQTGEETRVLKDPDEYRLQDIEFSPQGDLLVSTAFVLGTVKLWNTQTGEVVAELPRRTVDEAAFSPDGKSLLIAPQGSVPEIWAVQTATQTGSLDPGPYSNLAYFSDVDFSPDGDYIATSLSTDAGGQAQIHRASGDLVAVLNHDGAINDLAFSADRNLLATANDDSTAKV